MNKILARLDGDDLRSLGKSIAIISKILEDRSFFSMVFAGLYSEDPVFRMRSADMLEKVTRSHPDLLKDFEEN